MTTRRRFIKQAGAFGLFLPVYEVLRPLAYAQSPQQQVMISQKVGAGGGGSAPTFDAVASDGAGGTTVLTMAATIGAIASGLLLPFIAHRRDGTTSVVSAVWNGSEGATFVATIAQGDTVFELWQLINPTTGTHNLVITITGGNSTIVCNAVSIAGAHQTTPLGTPATNTGIASPITATAPGTGANDFVIDGFFSEEPAANIIVGPDQTNRFLDNTGGTMDNGISTQAGSDGGVMTWTSATDAGNWASIAVAIKPL